MVFLLARFCKSQPGVFYRGATEAGAKPHNLGKTHKLIWGLFRLLEGENPHQFPGEGGKILQAFPQFATKIISF